MKQTAVDWLIEQVKSKEWQEMFIWHKEELFEQAKQIEKEQKKTMFDCGRQYQLTGEGTFTQVYNELYNK